MALDGAQEFDRDVRLFGRTDRAATGAYQFRPLGRPQIEAYFGGNLAAELEANGDGAFFDFAVSELTGLLGSDFRRRLKPIRIHRWGLDPLSLGSYSLRCLGPQIAAKRSPNRLMIDCSSPAKPVQSATFRPPMALGKPAWPPPIK